MKLEGGFQRCISTHYDISSQSSEIVQQIFRMREYALLRCSLDSVEHLRVITPCDYPSSFDFIFQEITRPADLALGPCFDLVAPKTMYKYYATRSIFSIELSHRCWLNLLYLCCIAWID
jgi:hypothetical protein